MSLPPPSPQQARIIWLALTGLAMAVMVGFVAGLIWGLGKILNLLGPVLWPLAVAGVMAYILDPVVDWFSARRVPRTRAILLVFGLAAGLSLALISSVLPQIVVESRQFSERVPEYIDNVGKSLQRWVAHPPGWFRNYLRSSAAAKSAAPASSPGGAVPDAAPTPSTGTNSLDAVTNTMLERLDMGAAATWAGQNFPQAVSRFLGLVSDRVAGFLGLLAGLSLIPIYLFYFLAEKKGITGKWQDYLPLRKSELRDEVAFVIQAINDCMVVFFRGQVLVAICGGTLYTIGFLAIGLPYALLIGVMAIFLTMVPYLGAVVTCLIALVVAFAQFGDWQHPALVLAIFVVVQNLEGFVIQPKIIGDRIGLHPLTLIVALMVGTTLLGGLLGGILAIPLTAALRVLMFRYVWKQREPA
jgi:predicted PurR-regulated permease PerM